MSASPLRPAPAPEGSLLAVGPTSEFWRYLWFPAVFSLGALLLRQELVFLLGVLVVGCGAAAYPLCRRNLRGVRVSRRVGTRARVGAAAVGQLLVENRGPGTALGLEVEDRPGRSVRASLGQVEVPALGSGRHVTARTLLHFQRRGWARLAAPSVASRFPLGVFRARRRGTGEAEVLVRPREGRPTAALVARLRAGAPEAERRAARRRGIDELCGVREYREGDDPRRVHPLVSARRGAPVVTEWLAEQGREVLLVLAPAPREGPELERAISVTATLWRLVLRGRTPARLAAGRRLLAPRPGAPGLAAGLDALAEVGAHESGRVRAALRALARHPGRRSVVLVGPVEDAALLALARRAAGPGGDAWTLATSGPGLARWVEGLA